MKTNCNILTLIALSATMLSSCIWQPIMQQFTRDQYPGERPPKVIPDVGTTPSDEVWLKIDEDMLPPSSQLTKEIETADDGLPYGIVSEFSDIVTSPYAPHYQLDCTGLSAGTKVWDPYTRKAFYIPRTYTFN